MSCFIFMAACAFLNTDFIVIMLFNWNVESKQFQLFNKKSYKSGDALLISTEVSKQFLLFIKSYFTQLL